MSVIEIVGGAILLVASLVIVFLTLMQHTHGQGLSGAINGSMGGANNARLTPADQMLPRSPALQAWCSLWLLFWLACLQAVWQAEKALQPRERTGLFFCAEKSAGSRFCGLPQRGDRGKCPSQGRAVLRRRCTATEVKEKIFYGNAR